MDTMHDRAVPVRSVAVGHYSMAQAGRQLGRQQGRHIVADLDNHWFAVVVHRLDLGEGPHRLED
jgi:hypothetical protein